jgi:hypothetical protein
MSPRTKFHPNLNVVKDGKPGHALILPQLHLQLHTQDLLHPPFYTGWTGSSIVVLTFRFA